MLINKKKGSPMGGAIIIVGGSIPPGPKTHNVLTTNTHPNPQRREENRRKEKRRKEKRKEGNKIQEKRR